MAQETKEPESKERSSDDKKNEQSKGPKGEGNTCPECGEPIEDLRASCKNCGYEYKAEDYDDEEKGNEFLAGSNIDDEGEEITDSGPGVEEGAE